MIFCPHKRPLPRDLVGQESRTLIVMLNLDPFVRYQNIILRRPQLRSRKHFLPSPHCSLGAYIPCILYLNISYYFPVSTSNHCTVHMFAHNKYWVVNCFSWNWYVAAQQINNNILQTLLLRVIFEYFYYCIFMMYYNYIFLSRNVYINNYTLCVVKKILYHEKIH